MSARRTFAALAAASLLTVGLSACAESARDAGTTGTTGGGGGDTFTFGAAGAPKVLDPYYATDGETFRVARQQFEGLVMFKPGTADPEKGGQSLATDWKASDDGLTWTFTLREGVKFSDGTAFNAEAVCKNFERMFNQTGGQTSALYWSENFGGFKDGKEKSLYAGCTAKDAKTVDIKLTRVTSKFPAILGLPSFYMQSPTAMEKYDANKVTPAGQGFTFSEYATAHPTGTGPFVLENYDQANKTVTLKRNDNYWGTKPKIAKLIFKIIPDEVARRQALQSGSIQGYDFPNPVDWAQLKDGGNTVMVRPAFNIMYFGFNPNSNPKLKDLKVRQAIMLAINREQIVKTQLPEAAKAASQFIPETVAGYNMDLKVPEYNPDKAKQLLAEAGATGMTLDFWYPSEVTRPYMPAPVKIYEAAKADLEKVGIKVNTTTKPWNGGYLDQVDAGKAAMFILGWTGDYNTADNFIGTFFSSLDNRFGLKNYEWGPELVQSLKDADSTPDEAARVKKYEDINKKLVEQYLPAVPVSHSPPAIVVKNTVKGITPSPLTDEKFADVTVG